MNAVQPGAADSAFRLSVLYGALYVTFGVALPYMPLWLAGRGFDAATIGLLLAISPLIRIAATPAVAGLADTRLGAAPLLALGQALSVAALIGLALGEGVVAVAIFLAFLAIAQAPLVPVADALTLDAIRADPRLRYGRLRLWASLTFIAANVAGGFALEAWGTGFVVWAQIACALTGLGAALYVRRVPVARRSAQAALASAATGRAGRVLLLVILASALIQASHAALYGFGSLLWTKQGFSGAAIGLFWAASIAVEVAILYAVVATGQGARRALAMMALGGATALLRWTALSFDLGFAATLAAQALHGVSFAATHLGALAALDALSPPVRRARTQGVLAATTAAAMAAGTALSGRLFETDPFSAFLAMAAPATLGLACVGVAWRGAAGQDGARG